MLHPLFGANQLNCLGLSLKNLLYNRAEIDVAYITRFGTIQEIWDKVFECAINCIGDISQNALSLIRVPPSGENSQRQIKFFSISDRLTNLHVFLAMFRPPKMHLFRNNNNNKLNHQFMQDTEVVSPS